MVVIFEYRMRPDADLDAYAELSEAMRARAAADPGFGFLDMTSATSEDGTHSAISRFRDADGMRRWARDPRHREAQRRGRTEFYEWYRVRVCEEERAYEFEATSSS